MSTPTPLNASIEANLRMLTDIAKERDALLKENQDLRAQCAERQGRIEELQATVRFQEESYRKDRDADDSELRSHRMFVAEAKVQLRSAAAALAASCRALAIGPDEPQLSLDDQKRLESLAQSLAPAPYIEGEKP